MLALQPNLTDMDPFTVNLLLAEQKSKNVIKEEDEVSD